MKTVLMILASLGVGVSACALANETAFLEQLQAQRDAVVASPSVSAEDANWLSQLRQQAAAGVLAPSARDTGPDALVADQQFLEQLRDQSAALLKNPPAIPEGLVPQDIAPQDRAWLDKLKTQHEKALQQFAASSPEQGNSVPAASPMLYFVSFSIPENGLKQMLPEAANLGIPALINGLIDNDFRKTAGAVFELTKESGNGGVQIDPKAFSEFGITQVPALVVHCDDGFDVLYGNVRIQTALERLAAEGDCQAITREFLQNIAASEVP